MSPSMIGQTPSIMARDLTEVKEILNGLAKRDNCVKCDDETTLTCPQCRPGETCQFTVPTNCMQCPKSFCMKDNTPASNGGNVGNGGGSGPSAGPIAGGVIGGIAAISVITYLIWRFVIKPKRASSGRHRVYQTDANPARQPEKDDSSRITRRSSTHTVHSIASTVLTRASNIIQIAYIPGVTNRATPTSPTLLVPPVPPIPSQHIEGSRRNTQDDQHFFVPGNLRDSTYSGISSLSDRTSYAPRSSIASTIYGKQAQIQTPAQTGMRAKPIVVSVKSAAVGASAPGTPPVPSIDYEKFGPGRPQSAASNNSNFSIGTTYVNTATQGRAQVVKLGSGLRKVDIAARSDASQSSTSLASDSSSSKASSTAMPLVEESPSSDLGPFSDPPERRITVTTPNLGPVAEEGEPLRGPAERTKLLRSEDRGQGPFGDENATKE